MKSIAYRSRAITAALLGAMLLAACGGGAAPTSSAPSSAGPASSAKPASSSAPASSAAAAGSASAAAPGGELTFVVPALSLENFDPSKTSSLFITPSIGAPIYQQLWQYAPPNGAIVPFLLQSATMAPDAMSWTLKLRDGIKFSNGDPMTSDDVKFSLDRYLSKESATSNAATMRSTIDKVDVVDKLAVKVTLKAPTIDLPAVITYPGNSAVIVSKKYVGQVGWDGLNKKPIGSGPYVMSDHKVGESITYTPNPNYWGGPTGKAKPTLSKITILKVPEEQTRIAMLQQGKADLIDISPTSMKQTQQAGFKILQVPDATTITILLVGTWGDYANNPLKKLEVRKALTLALDKKAMLDALWAGAGQVASIFPPPNPALGAPQLPPTPYDPNQAKQLLQQAGYPNGFPLKFWATNIVDCSATFASQLAQTAAAYWSKIGVQTQVVPVDYTILRPKVFAPKWPADVVGTAFDWCTGGGSPKTPSYSIYYSKGPVHMSDAGDADIAKALNAKTADEAYKATAAAWTKLYEAYASIPVFYGSRVFAGDKKTDSYALTRAFPDMLSWWVSELPSA